MKTPFPALMFLTAAAILAGVLILGCSTEEVVLTGVDGAPGEAGSSCSVERREAGALISCDDGTNSYIYDGAPGRDGESGAGCEVAQLETCLVVSCSDASIAEVCNGTDGQIGESCSVSQSETGVTITCGASEAFIPTAPTPPSPDNGVVCHKGNTLTIPAAAVSAHLAHGDSLGACS